VKAIREVVFYVVLVLVFVYAARQLEGFSVGRIEADVPSFLKFVR
jgi:hypothetical protein